MSTVRPITGKTKEKKLANFNAFFSYIRPTYEKGGLKAAADLVFDMLNVYPKWVQGEGRESSSESSAKFLAMRTRLQAEGEGGLVISNHPMAPIDSFSIIKALSRDGTNGRRDFKILVCEEIYMEAYRKNFDPALFVSPSELATPAGFADATEHVKRGGLFIVFPSGVNDDLAESVRFFDGLGDLLLVVPKSTMVYSFFTDPADTVALRKDHPALFLGLFLQVKLKLPAFLNVNKWRKPDTFGVDEWCAQAGEWQAALAGARGSDRKKYGDVLADFYRSRFSKV